MGQVAASPFRAVKRKPRTSASPEHNGQQRVDISRPGTRRAAAQSLPRLACTSMTAFSGVRLSSRRQRTTGERRGPAIRSENGNRQERVDSAIFNDRFSARRCPFELATTVVATSLATSIRRSGTDLSRKCLLMGKMQPFPPASDSANAKNWRGSANRKWES
jgi:hypothetical protein